MFNYTEEEKQKNCQLICNVMTAKFCQDNQSLFDMKELQQTFINIICNWLTINFVDEVERISHKEKFFQDFNSTYDEMLKDNEENRIEMAQQISKREKTKQMLEALKNLTQSE